MTGSVAGIRRRRMVAGRRETPHLPPDRDFYGQTLSNFSHGHGYAKIKVVQNNLPSEKLTIPLKSKRGFSSLSYVYLFRSGCHSYRAREFPAQKLDV